MLQDSFGFPIRMAARLSHSSAASARRQSLETLARYANPESS